MMSGSVAQLCWVIGQMLIVAALMYGSTRQAMSANRRLLIWRCGFVLLAALPWLQPQMAVIQLPWLPDNLHLTGQAAFMPQAEALDPVPDPQNSGFALIGWLTPVLGVSALLLFSWCRRLFRLHQITRQSPRVEHTAWMTLAAGCQLQLGLTRLPELRINDSLNTPCTWGFLRPVILLPSQVSDAATLRIILLHEMAHIKRRDWLWMSLTELITLVFWFNPFLWWIKRQLINGFESACDDLVLQQSIKPSAYAETLLRFHQPRPHQTPLAVMMAEHSVLYQRLNTILNPPTRRLLMNHKKQTLITASVVTLMTLTGITQLTQAQAEQTDPMYPEPPAAVQAPHPVPHPEPHVAVQPDQPPVPGRVMPPARVPQLPQTPAPQLHPRVSVPPVPAFPEGQALRQHEHELHLAAQRLRSEEQRLQRLHTRDRDRSENRRAAAERSLRMAEQRLSEQQQVAKLSRVKALEHGEQRLIREQRMLEASAARVKAAEQALKAQQERLELERLNLLEQQEKVRLAMEQAEQHPAQ